MTLSGDLLRDELVMSPAPQPGGRGEVGRESSTRVCLLADSDFSANPGVGAMAKIREVGFHGARRPRSTAKVHNFQVPC